MKTLDNKVAAQADKAADTLKDMEGAIRQRWSKLTDKDLQRIAGKSEELVGVLQDKYGYTRKEASRMLEDLAGDLDKKRDELQKTAAEASEWVKNRPIAMVAMAGLAALIGALVYYFVRVRTETERQYG